MLQFCLGQTLDWVDYIGSLKGTDFCPFEEAGLRWRTNIFKLWVLFFLLILIHFMNLILSPKLHQIEQTINCWRHRNVSLLGKVTVIKSLLLLQLLYLFSVLCISIHKIYFKKLTHLFFKFIWNGGNDRAKRDILCNDYEHGGLRMFYLHIFSYTQNLFE